MNADAVPPDITEVAAEKATAPIVEAPSPSEARAHHDSPANANRLADPPPSPAIDLAESTSPAEGQEAISARLAELLQHMHKLQCTFDDKIRYDAGREALIDRLHTELQEYKADLTLKILRPLSLDLIYLHDAVGRLISEHQAATQSELGATLLRLFASFQGEIEVILARHGFDSFTTSEPHFDPKRQKALRRLQTSDPQLDRTIAERCRPGFTYDNRMLRPEIVAVYVYQPSIES